MHLVGNNRTMQQVVSIMIVLMSVIVAILAGVIGYDQPILLVVGLFGIILAVMSFVWIDVTVMAFFVVLLTNTATISVKFHGVPFVVGAAFPLLLFFPLMNYVIIKRERLIITPLMFLLLGHLFRIISIVNGVKL